ncbi:hypothetical protein F4780DRAFT_780659 [Xylariomycetidae sp. FL0641]|nr:hypothetical protein F4780DRAFT_780659 [Xylariomycetidae sp. FL0641]
METSGEKYGDREKYHNATTTSSSSCHLPATGLTPPALRILLSRSHECFLSRLFAHHNADTTATICGNPNSYFRRHGSQYALTLGMHTTELTEDDEMYRHCVAIANEDKARYDGELSAWKQSEESRKRTREYSKLQISEA